MVTKFMVYIQPNYVRSYCKYIVCMYVVSTDLLLNIFYLMYVVGIMRLNVMITSVTETSISLSWTKPFILTETVVYYQVS